MKSPPELQPSNLPVPSPPETVAPTWTEEDEEELRHFREMAKASREVTRRWMAELIRPAE
jgi:hypothetical protein